MSGENLQIEGLWDTSPQARPPAGGAEGLTSEQESAVARRAEPLLLAAAAGSGKTTVLVERFVQAVLEDGVVPARIVAITFTDRAAGELRERVRRRFLELDRRDAARDTEAAFVSTFHGFCARVLRAHALLAGLDPHFGVLEEDLAGDLRARAFAGALAEFLAGGKLAAVDLVAAYGAGPLETMVTATHAELRTRGMRSPRLPRPAAHAGDPASEPALAACLLIDELLDCFTRTYEQLKMEGDVVDFDDLELLARDLLVEHPGLRRSWSERFELIMVDEFQDTNARQMQLLDQLDRGNLFTVGDERQSIYGFRHADVGLFTARRAELAARGGSLALRQNFRSARPLLDAVNTVFAERLGEAFEPLIAGRVEPPAGAAGEAPRVELLLSAKSGWDEHPETVAALGAGLPPAPAWRQGEARLLAARVGELVDGGQARAGEIVVLLRAAGDIEVYESALQLRGLRTHAVVGRFWGRQQTRELLCYLRVLANPLADTALYETLASPLVGLSGDGLALLASAAREVGSRPWEAASRWAEADGQAQPEVGGLALLGPDDRDRLASFCAWLRQERGASARLPIARMLERAIERSGYEAHLLALQWGPRRLANVHKLLRIARRYEAGAGRDLGAFLGHVERLEREEAREADAPVDSVEPDVVRLMTIHAAKGLEFPVVCVADLGRAPNKSQQKLLLDGDRVGLSLQPLEGGKALPTLDYEALSLERAAADAREEERIVYVAMTRARERLICSGAIDLECFGEEPGTTVADWLAPALTGGLPAPLSAGELELELASAGDGGAAWTLRVSVCDPPHAAGLLPDASAAQASQAPPVAAAPPPARSAPPAAQAPRVFAAGSVSYTSLALFESCGYRYYLERVLGLPERQERLRGEAEGLRARTRGVLAHGLLEVHDFRSAEGPAPAAVAARARELGIAVGDGQAAELAALIATAAASPTARRIADSHEVGREHPFAFSVGPHLPLVTGVIDLLARGEDGTWLVLDYKSDRVGADADLEALVERDYGLQRLLYAIAVLRLGAPAVEVLHWFLAREREPVGAVFAAEQLPELAGRLLERLEGARERGYAVSERPHRELCLTCPGRGGMCSWPEEATLAPAPVAAS